MKRAKSAAVWGPMDASYTLRWPGSGCSSSYGTLDRARSEIAYFRRQGREGTPTLTRTESCPAPGCGGEGTRAVRRRGSGIYSTDVPCVGCLGRHEILEDVAALEPIAAGDRTLTDVLAELGFTHTRTTSNALAGELGAHDVMQNGFVLFTGRAGSVWEWLRDTGRIL